MILRTAEEMGLVDVCVCRKRTLADDNHLAKRGHPFGSVVAAKSRTPPSHGIGLYSAEVNQPFRLELLMVGDSGPLDDRFPLTYEYPKEMFPLVAVCALAARERNRRANPTVVILRMAEQALLSLGQEFRFHFQGSWHGTSL